MTENVKSMEMDEATQDQVVLGRALRALRDGAELRQDELGVRLGIDSTYISQIENGRRGVRWHTVMRFLRALDASAGDLAALVEQHAKASDLRPVHRSATRRVSRNSKGN